MALRCSVRLRASRWRLFGLGVVLSASMTLSNATQISSVPSSSRTHTRTTYGRVVAVDGETALPNVRLQLESDASAAPVRSDNEGRFAMAVPDQAVRLAASDLDGFIVRMSAGSSVTGRIAFEGGPLPSASDLELSPVPSEVDLVSLADNPVARVAIHHDWSFEMHGLNGPRRLMLTRAPAGWMLARVHVHGTDLTDAVLAAR